MTEATNQTDSKNDAAPKGKFYAIDKSGKPVEHVDSVFPIILQGQGKPQFLGTGFYLTYNGLLVTASHVLVDALEEIKKIPAWGNLEPISYKVNPDRGLCLFHYQTPQTSIQRPITWIGLSQIKEVGLKDIGIATSLPMKLSDEKDLEVQRLISSSLKLPAEGGKICSYGFADHELVEEEKGKFKFNFNPKYYEGRFIGIDEERRKSGKPYCQVDMVIPGGNSGAPVFDETGRIWGICSQSIEGKRDCAWVTPLAEILNIELPARFEKEGKPEIVTVKDLIDRGYLKMKLDL